MHRLIYLYHKGYFPENQIDHINRIKCDNSIENLREVSQSCNFRNKNVQLNNSSKIKGIHFCNERNKWVVQITVNKKIIFLGRYSDILDAACTRLAAEQCLNWEGCDSLSTAYKYIKENL